MLTKESVSIAVISITDMFSSFHYHACYQVKLTELIVFSIRCNAEFQTSEFLCDSTSRCRTTHIFSLNITVSKSNLGANAILGVSVLNAKVAAFYKGMQL